MRKEIYLGIIKALKTIPEIQHFDLWNQNVEFAQEDIFPTPAVFVEFDPILYKAVKETKQYADVAIKLHIVTDASGQSYDGSTSQSDSLQFFDLIDKIYRAIITIDENNYGCFVRTGSYTNSDHGDLMESIETYTCKAVDVSAV